jgi:Ca-activated chloride channel family protein
MRKYFLLISGLLICQVMVFADDSGAILSKANGLYKNKQYSQALGLYEKALADKPDSPLINFNAGDAQYRLDQFDKAAGLFEKALLAGDKKTESRANYNLATAKYKLSEADEKKNPAEAGKDLESAEGYYKRAIELDERDQDAKINYELTVKKLKELKEKQQQQKSQQEQDKQQPQQKDQQGQPEKSEPNKDKEQPRPQ